MGEFLRVEYYALDHFITLDTSCVFPSDFPERTFDGKRVKTHGEFLDYLCAKHHKIRREKLPFVETDTAKNVVLYMLEHDIGYNRTI